MVNFKSNPIPLVQVQLLEKVKPLTVQLQPYVPKNTKEKNKSQTKSIRKRYNSVREFRAEVHQLVRDASPASLAVLNLVIERTSSRLGYDACLNEFVAILKQSHPQEHWYTKKVSMLLHFWSDQKVITMVYRYRDQSVYYPAHFFNELKVRRKLRRFLPALTEDKVIVSKLFENLSVKFNSARSKYLTSKANISTSFRSILYSSSSSLLYKQSTTRCIARAREGVVMKQVLCKPTWICKVGCVGVCKDGWSTEHAARVQAATLGKKYIPPSKKVEICPLGCASGCYANGVYSAEHIRKQSYADQLLGIMQPGELQKATKDGFNAQFGKQLNFWDPGVNPFV